MTDDIVKYLRLSQTRFNRHAEAADEIERLRAIVKELHDHLGEALYSDEWDTREYAIVSYSRYEGEPC